MTTNIEVTNPPDIMSSKPEDVKALHALSAEGFAKSLAEAPGKADLLRAQAVREMSWTNRGVKKLIDAVEIANAINDAMGHAEGERDAMLRIIRGGAFRRHVPPLLAEATEELDYAERMISDIWKMDQPWADRLKGAIEYERRMLLAPLGKYREAAKLGYQDAETQLKTAKPEEILQILFQVYRIAAVMEFNAAPIGSPSVEYVTTKAYDFLNLLRQMTIHDPFKQIQVKLDMIRVAWLAKLSDSYDFLDCYFDFGEAIQWIGEQIANDDGLKKAYAWSHAIMAAAVGYLRWIHQGLSIDTEELKRLREAACAVADDPEIGYDWRPEAMLVVAQISALLGDRATETEYKEKIRDLPQYFGPLLGLV